MSAAVVVQALCAEIPLAGLVVMTAFQEREVREGRYEPPEGVSLLMLIREWMQRETG